MGSKKQAAGRPMGVPPDDAELRDSFSRFAQVVAQLRSPEGCPWDREQTLESIKPYTLEETYELLEAIDSGNDEEIVGELGDVLLQVVLDAQIGADEGRFGLVDVIQGITEKMVRRHPHVFGSGRDRVDSVDAVFATWQQAKATEKSERARQSALDGIPAALPALATAIKLTKKAARVGYDFPDRTMLFDKLREELSEFTAEISPDEEIVAKPASVDGPPIPDLPIADTARRQRAEEELGDVLFVIANIARRWGLDAEEGLRRTNAKFRRRFQAIEAGLASQGRRVEDASLNEMEAHYQAYKRLEKES